MGEGEGEAEKKDYKALCCTARDTFTQLASAVMVAYSRASSEMPSPELLALQEAAVVQMRTILANAEQYSATQVKK